MSYPKPSKVPSHILTAIGAADGEMYATECPSYSELLTLLREARDLMPLGNRERLEWMSRVTQYVPAYLL